MATTRREWACCTARANRPPSAPVPPFRNTGTPAAIRCCSRRGSGWRWTWVASTCVRGRRSEARATAIWKTRGWSPWELVIAGASNFEPSRDRRSAEWTAASVTAPSRLRLGSSKVNMAYRVIQRLEQPVLLAQGPERSQVGNRERDAKLRHVPDAGIVLAILHAEPAAVRVVGHLRGDVTQDALPIVVNRFDAGVAAAAVGVAIVEAS